MVQRALQHAVGATRAAGSPGGTPTGHAALLRRLGALLSAALAAAGAWAQNYPRPEFTQGETFPPLTTPPPRAEVFVWVDMAVLAAMLLLAAFLVIRQRQRSPLLWLSVFGVVYFGFYRRGCVCSVGAIQNVAAALGGTGYELPLAVGVFFLLPLLAAVFFGRVFCSGVCPLGAAQELVLLRPLKVPAWLDGVLSLLPFFYLGGAVLFAVKLSSFIVCRYDPFVLFYRLGGSVLMLVIGVLVLLLSTVVGRPYCRYACPYGVLLRWLSPLSAWRAQITRKECVNCTLCDQSCPYGAIRPPTPPNERFDRRSGRRQLLWLLVVLPAIVAAAAVLMRLSSPMLARVDPTVRLAERVYLEEKGLVQGTTEATEAWANRGILNGVLYAQAAKLQKWYDTGSWYFGAWIGLVFGVRLVGTVLRRRRETYQIDVGSCFGCGRCFSACPLDRGVAPEAVHAAAEPRA